VTVKKNLNFQVSPDFLAYCMLFSEMQNSMVT